MSSPRGALAAAGAAGLDSWDCTLPGPPSCNNFGSADLSPLGFLAFTASSSISVVDSRSLQLISTIPLPSPSPSNSNSLSPFVTSVRWTPLPLRRDLLSMEASSSHLLLAAAYGQVRICILDFRDRSSLLWFETNSASKPGIQDLYWVQARPDSCLLAAINGPSTLSLYSASSARCVFQYDAAPEFLSCLRRDPFDSNHFCALGFKGFLLSVKVLGETEDDIVLKELQIPTDCAELQRLERDATASAAGSNSASPTSAVFPLYMARVAFSPLWKHIVYVTFPRELVVFDLKYETVLFTTALPRGCGKFLNVLPYPNKELLYCVHLDGKLSTWRRKE